MYINQNVNNATNGSAACESSAQMPDNYFSCSGTPYTAVRWNTSIVDGFGWKARYELPFSWLGRDTHYRANFHRNGRPSDLYQSSWSAGQNVTSWKHFHCPYIFGILELDAGDDHPGD